MFYQFPFRLTFSILLVFIFISSNTLFANKNRINNEGFIDVMCEEAREIIKKNSNNENFVIIDFRPASMYKKKHIEGAIFHDVFSDDIEDWLQQLDKNKTYLIYCTIGHRSGIGMGKMKKSGFINICHMHEGLSQWTELGYKTVSGSFQKQSIIQFNENNWQLINGEFVEYQGRNSLKGMATLKDVEFENGSIEFDINVTGQRSYPGIAFRTESSFNAENIYIRPHIIGIGDNALQYTPIFNGEACWQLYSGDGFTSALDMPLNDWVHFKLEVQGSQARVYIGETKEPTLQIDYLKHFIKKGGITLSSPPNGSAHFSNFKIDTTAKLNFETPLLEATPPGIITDWEITLPIKYSKIDLEKSYSQQELEDISWHKISPEISGLVNISRKIKRKGREPDFIFARTTIESELEKDMELKFGYSDWIVIFLNGEMLFNGSSPYRGRGTSFQGIIGLYDAVNLPLKKGTNELEFIVGETFGGWGFMAQDGKAVFMKDGIEKLWESDKVFSTSESVLYDAKREVLYVTNFDQFNVRNPNVQQFISKVSLDGKIENLKWIDGLNNPLGMTIYKDNLYVAERNEIAVIDLHREKITERYPIPGSVFLNDITIDNSGKIYITDSRKNVIWRYSSGKVEQWLSGKEVSDPNVIYYHDNKILFGNSDDRNLKSVDPQTKEVKLIAKFEKGFIDGIRIDTNGNYLVSLWHGILYRVTQSGQVSEILDTSTPGYYSADFEYINDKNLLIIPTFFGNTITAYDLK